MMPAKVRSEGAALYKSGRVQDVTIDELRLTATVSGEPVVYDLDGNADACNCAIFQTNHRYCPHIAAIEEYLKYETDSKNEIETARESEKARREESEAFSQGRDFLATINADLTRHQKQHFSLSAEVFDSATADDFAARSDVLAVTLRLFIRENAKSYVIRDIPAFLSALRQHHPYSLGQLYFSEITQESFDADSRALIDFLLTLDADSEGILSTEIYRKAGRYMLMPYVLVEEFLDLLEHTANSSLKIAGELQPYWTFAALDQRSDIFTFNVVAQKDDILLTFEAEEAFTLYRQHYLYFENTFYSLTGTQIELLRRLEHLPDGKLRFSYDEKDNLAQALQAFATLGRVNAPESFKIHDFKPNFTFQNQGKNLQISMFFDYGDFEIKHFHDLETLEFARNLRLEKQIFDLLAETGFPRAFEGTRPSLAKGELFDFYEIMLPAFGKLGTVTLGEDLEDFLLTAEPDVAVSTHGNLLDISFSLPDVAEDEYGALFDLLKKGNSHYVTDSGKLVKFDSRFSALKEALTTFDDITIHENHLETANFRALAISKIFENTDSESFNANFQKLYQDLTSPQNYPFTKPETLQAELRSYQVDGVRWMSMLTHYQMSGILADDMGLGKTLQAITYLLSNLTDHQKALIVAPSSLVYNWASEFEKFATGILDIATIDGARETRKSQITAQHQISITSYGSFLKDAADYVDIDYLLLDEAQVVKNFNSKTNKALASFKAAHAFALSGTPIENKLDELWAIFNILMPGLLPARKAFNKMRPDAILRTISPFVLRRKKEDVLKELPDKLEITHLSELTDSQKVIYLAQLEQMQQRVSAMSAQDFKRSHIEILAGITRLRQICDSPALFLDDYTGSSGKLDSLNELLQQIKDSGRRPLIFSQFTSMFPLIEHLLEKHDLTAYKLTGSTPAKERLEMVRAFNTGSRDLFLISLKAGGTGLNLASSDMVILVDLWWNPAVEEQAISRAHRMGQENMVEVIRLITKGTIEEKIVEIQKRKKDLFTSILDNTGSASQLTQADINEILGIQA
jgi:superfamily II DNA or RNA helicase